MKSKKIFRRCLATALLAIIGAILPVLPALAVSTSTLQDVPWSQDADESSSTPFTLDICSVWDDDIDVATDAVLQINFTKNMVNFAVLEHNATCFHLVDRKGKAVEIELIFPDDQLQQTIKRCVFIRPTQKLQPGSKYTLAIDNTLQTKNGDYIDQAYNIKFTTGDGPRHETPDDLLRLSDNVMSYVTATQMGANSVHGTCCQNGAAALQFTPDPATKPDISRLSLYVAALCALLALFFIFTMVRQRRARSTAKKETA